MSNVNLSWDADGTIDSYTIYRSESPMSVESLPAPIAENVLDKTYSDTTVVDGTAYYYRVASVAGESAKVSDEVMVKASAGDEYWNNVISLLNFEASIIDEKSRIWTALTTPVFTADGFQLTGNNLATPYSTDFDWNTGSYTIEGFVKASVWSSWSLPGLVNGIPLLIGRMGQTNDLNQWSFGPVSSGKVHFYYFSGGQKLLISSNNTLPTNELVHISFCKDANNAYVSIAGIVTSLALPSSIVLPVVSENISVGRYNNSRITGFLGGLRITKGVARYTANFTPPDAPFPSS